MPLLELHETELQSGAKYSLYDGKMPSNFPSRKYVPNLAVIVSFNVMFLFQ